MGFVADIEEILSLKPQGCQVMLFSATMPRAIQMLSGKYLNKPEVIDVVPKTITKDSITQAYFNIRSDFKTELVARLIVTENPKLGIVFTNTKQASIDLVYDLQERGFSVEAINGDLDQRERERVMDRFRKGAIQILVATDVAARGIDVKDVEMVINYDLPMEKEFYVHRIGRTGRNGSLGKAFSFVCNGLDRGLLSRIEHYAKTKIEKAEPITSDMIYSRKVDNLVTKLKPADKINARTAAALAQLMGDKSAEEVALNLVEMIIGVPESDIPELKDGVKQKRNGQPMGQIAINIGKAEGATAQTIVLFIKKFSDTFPRNIGDINIFKEESIIEVPLTRLNRIAGELDGKVLKGKKIIAKIAQ
jgi:ATP-dependent RNA helicase DeaD